METKLRDKTRAEYMYRVPMHLFDFQCSSCNGIYLNLRPSVGSKWVGRKYYIAVHS